METLPLLPVEPTVVGGQSSENERLLDAARHGDMHAFDELVASNQRRVFRQCLRRGLTEDEATDVVQDVFIKVYRSLGRYSRQNAFTTWLYRITENACIDHCRRRTRRQALLRPIPMDEEGCETEYAGREPDPLSFMVNREERSRIAWAFQQLPAKLREAFECKELEGLRYSEIANRLHCTVGTVKSRIYRARQMLVTELEAAV